MQTNQAHFLPPTENEIQVAFIGELTQLSDAEETFELHGHLDFRMMLPEDKVEATLIDATLPTQPTTFTSSALLNSSGTANASLRSSEGATTTTTGCFQQQSLGTATTTATATSFSFSFSSPPTTSSTASDALQPLEIGTLHHALHSLASSSGTPRSECATPRRAKLSYEALKEKDLHHVMPFRPDDSFFCQVKECNWDFDGTEFEIDGRVLCGHIEFSAVLEDPLDLHDFPFDRQNMNISLKLVGLERNRRVRLTFFGHRVRIHVASPVVLNEWQMEPAIEQYGLERHPRHGGPTSLEIRFRLQRIPRFYIFQIIIPLFLIVSLGFLASTLHLSELADRLSIILTLLLTTVAFKYMVAEYIPRVPYITVLDKYVTTGFLILFASAVEIGVMKALHNYHFKPYLYDAFGPVEREEQATGALQFEINPIGNRLDTIDKWFWLLIYTTYTVLHLLWFLSGCSDKPFRASWAHVRARDDEADLVIKEAVSSIPSTAAGKAAKVTSTNSGGLTPTPSATNLGSECIGDFCHYGDAEHASSHVRRRNNNTGEADGANGEGKPRLSASNRSISKSSLANSTKTSSRRHI